MTPGSGDKVDIKLPIFRHGMALTATGVPAILLPMQQYRRSVGAIHHSTA